MRHTRWCCQYIKEAGGRGSVVILGNRREEGTIRKKQKCFEKQRKGGGFFVRPIIDWSKEEVWEYIHANNIPYCELYDKGFHRLGCVLCPFSREIEREEFYFPKIVNLWKLACQRIVEQQLTSGKEYKYNFQTGEELYQWWVGRD